MRTYVRTFVLCTNVRTYVRRASDVRTYDIRTYVRKKNMTHSTECQIATCNSLLVRWCALDQLHSFLHLLLSVLQLRAYGRTYVRTHVRVYVRTYVRKHVRTYVRMFVRTYVCMYVRTKPRLTKSSSFAIAKRSSILAPASRIQAIIFWYLSSRALAIKPEKDPTSNSNIHLFRTYVRM